MASFGRGNRALYIEWSRWSAGYPLVPKLPQFFDILAARLTLEQPFPERLADHLAGVWVVTAIHRRLGRFELLIGEFDADFTDSGLGP